MSQTLDALVVQLKADISGFKSSLDAAGSNVSRFSSSAEKDINSVNTAIISLRRQIISMAAVWGTFKVGKEIYTAGVEIQALGYRMKAATGDAKIAAEALAFVRYESERLGLSFTDSAGSFASFAASALRSGMTFQQTKDVFTGIAEAVTALHLPAEQARSAFLAIEQMASKGTVQMQELKLQLAQAIPGAMEIMAKASGKSVQEFNSLIEKGQVLSADALPKLAQAFREQFGGAAVEASQGAQAAFNRMNNAFFDLKVQMADSGFLDAVTQSVKDLTTTLKDPAVVDGLVQLARALGQIAEMATKVASSFGSALYKVGEFEAKALGIVGIGVESAKGKDAIETASLRQRVMAQYIAEHGGNTSQTSSAGPSSSYTLGTPATTANSTAQIEAAKKAQQLREQLRKQVDSMAYGFATPEQQAGMDFDKQLKTLKEALDKRAITEKEYRDLSIKAEDEYQKNLKDIREKARVDEQSALESFLGIRIKTQEEMDSRTIQQQAESFRQTIAEAAKHNKTFFQLEKAASIARALIAAKESVVDAYKFGTKLGGPVVGLAFAGVAAAAQAANIQAIASTQYNGGGSSGVSASGNTSGSSSDTSSTASGNNTASKSVYITLNGDDMATYSKTQIRKLIENINDAVSDGTQLKVSVS